MQAHKGYVFVDEYRGLTRILITAHNNGRCKLVKKIAATSIIKFCALIAHIAFFFFLAREKREDNGTLEASWTPSSQDNTM